MKHFKYFLCIVFAFIVLFPPHAQAAVGSVYNGFLNRCDVNGDGSVSATDVTIVYNYLLDTGDVSAYDCDVDQDGAVTTADVTLIYNILLNGGFYNSIFDAFDLSVANYFNREYFKFTWTDINTAGYEVSNPDYMLVIATDETYSHYMCRHLSGLSETIGYDTLSEWLRSELGWHSPSDLPGLMTLYARVEVKLAGGSEVAISNERTFAHLPLVDFGPTKLWQAGAANNWGNPADGLAMNSDGTYTGYMFLNGDFKFKEDETTWDGDNWGTDNYGYAMSGNLVVNGVNLYAPQGFYMVDVDLSNMHYNLTTISSMSIIGSAVPNGTQWATDIDLTYNEDSRAWEVNCVLNAGEYKFRANHEWTLNWGGESLNNLERDGLNLTIDQPGAYNVKVYLTYPGNCHATVTRL